MGHFSTTLRRMTPFERWNPASVARLRQRQKFSGNVFNQKQRARSEKTNACGVRRSRIHHDDRRNGVSSFPDGYRLIQKWTEMDILTIARL
jgi:hypothetical protein